MKFDVLKWRYEGKKLRNPFSIIFRIFINCVIFILKSLLWVAMVSIGRKIEADSMWVII